jgi:hypothetical protein
MFHKHYPPIYSDRWNIKTIPIITMKIDYNLNRHGFIEILLLN